jgi:hypothetical protein
MRNPFELLSSDFIWQFVNRGLCVRHPYFEILYPDNTLEYPRKPWNAVRNLPGAGKQAETQLLRDAQHAILACHIRVS